MRPSPLATAPRGGHDGPMTPREVVQSTSTKGRRSLDAALIAFIVAVVAALALGGSGLLG